MVTPADPLKYVLIQTDSKQIQWGGLICRQQSDGTDAEWKPVRPQLPLEAI
jgi:hypothetical protein